MIDLAENKLLRVLVVDDDGEDRYHLSRLLAAIPDLKTEVLEAETRVESLSILRERSVDVIILDYRLGAESGLELLKEICRQEQPCPVVVTTGQGDEKIATRFMQHGASDYLIKGELTPHLLHRALDRAIAQSALRREKALLEEQVQQLQKMDAISTLAGGMAHDFNNILTGILGHVQLAQVAKDLEGVKRHLGSIERDCRRMADSLRRLMALNEPGSSARVKQISLNQVLNEFLMVLRHTVPPDVELDVREEAEGLLIEAQVPMLHQVLMNVCTNALEAMEEHGGKLRLVLKRVESPAFDESENLRPLAVIEVTDTGRGIPAELVHRVFEPFYTTKPLTSVKGSGLGMAVVWHAVTSMGGSVRISSDVNKGTKITLSFPLATGRVEAA